MYSKSSFAITSFYRSICLIFIILSTLHAQKEWRGGEIQSHEEFSYGTFSARIYCAMNSGTLSTFFLFKNSGTTDAVRWNEIDFEVFGKDSAYNWQSNVIWQDNPAGGLSMAEGHHNSSFSTAEGWHTYTIEWSPEKIIWKVDDEVAREFTDPAHSILVGPMKIMLNLWAHNTESWAGWFDTASLPVYQYIDWISYTPWSGSGHTFDSEPSFFEDFETLDNWNRSTHTWAENLADFDTDNVGVIDNDIVCLALTHETAQGISTYAPSTLNPNTAFAIKVSADNLCLTSEGTALECTGTNEQLWSFTEAGDGFHTITNVYTSRPFTFIDGSTKLKVIWLKNSELYQLYPNIPEDSERNHVVTFVDSSVEIASNTQQANQKFYLSESTPTPLSSSSLMESSSEVIQSVDSPLSSSNILTIESSQIESSNSFTDIISSESTESSEERTASSGSTTALSENLFQEFIHSTSTQLTVYHLDGTKVQTLTKESAIETFNYLSPGVYVVHTTNDSKQSSLKILNIPNK